MWGRDTGRAWTRAAADFTAEPLAQNLSALVGNALQEGMTPKGLAKARGVAKEGMNSRFGPLNSSFG